MPQPLVLVDDPNRHVPFDLARVLARCGAARLALGVEPQPGPVLAEASADGSGLAAACAVTAGAPVPLPRYRVRAASGGASAGPEFAAADAAATLLGLVPPPFALVVFTSPSTLPLVEALYADERTRPLLKVGITGWRLDFDYNLTQKLVSQGKLHYHEHGMSLERTLCRRLELMLRAHAERARDAPRAPDAPAAGAVNATA